ncbi:MAG: hypothetical protein QY318_02435 [Candidatus Dojkabacteria bacterium]|nr:MAG: hypothetical protein QY318_02435 [Candidatus Dojkabacteria bacterium]
MSPELQEAFSKLGISKIQAVGDKVMIRGKEHEIKVPLAEILGGLKSIQKQYYYDYFLLKSPQDYFHLRFQPILDLSEYPCTEKFPYVGFALNQYDSYFAVRLDDPSPEDPKTYFIDHDDFDGTEPRDKDVRISEFLNLLMELP